MVLVVGSRRLGSSSINGPVTHYDDAWREMGCPLLCFCLFIASAAVI